MPANVPFYIDYSRNAVSYEELGLGSSSRDWWERVTRIGCAKASAEIFSILRVQPVIGAGLLVVALLASYLPARRASRIDPMVALRVE